MQPSIPSSSYKSVHAYAFVILFCLFSKNINHALSSSSDKLLGSLLLLHQLVRRPLDNATSHWQLRAHTSEESINIASRLSAFVDTPGPHVSTCHKDIGRCELLTRQSNFVHVGNHRLRTHLEYSSHTCPALS